MEENNTNPSPFLPMRSSAHIATHTSSDDVSRLQGSSCGGRCLLEVSLLLPACPTWGSHALVEIQRLSLREPGWPLMPRLGVR